MDDVNELISLRESRLGHLRLNFSSKNQCRDYEKHQNRIIPASNAIGGVQFDEIFDDFENFEKNVEKMVLSLLDGHWKFCQTAGDSFVVSILKSVAHGQ